MNQENANVIKHLEMLQAIITRMGQNSFLLKGWSITLLSVILVFMVRNDLSAWFALVLLIPILTFWALDAYYLRQERLFRDLYDKVRDWQETDFSMPIPRYSRTEQLSQLLKTAKSVTLFAFYITEFGFMLVAFGVVLYTS